MKWLNVDAFTFPVHGAILCISRIDEKNFEKTLDEIKSWRESPPEALESFFRGLIGSLRPELSGCVLRGVAFTFPRFEWEVIVEHPSLPVCELGDEFERMSLIPNKQQIE